MNRGRYRWLFRLAALLVAGLAFLLWAARGRSQDLLAVENRSGQPIALLEITVAGQTSTFRDVPAGADVTAALGGKSDDPFVVEGRLADGTMVRGRFAHVADALGGGRTGLVVLPGGQILFRQAGKTSPD
jgi:hypothetical protein